jgi:hypothetical protein
MGPVIAASAAAISASIINKLFGMKGDAAKLITFLGVATAAGASGVASFTYAANVKIAETALAQYAAGEITKDLAITQLTSISTVTETAASEALVTARTVNTEAGLNMLKSPIAKAQPWFLKPFTKLPFGGTTWGAAFWFSIAVMIVTMIVMKLMGIGKKKEVIVTFACLPWQPPTGGADCELCNKGPLGGEMKPCSEYRCSSLGATCSLLNVGTGNETCVALQPDDTNAPIIKPSEDVLTYGHVYTDVKPCPPGPGCWKISRTGAKDGCIKAFTPLTFGIETNEPAQCKVDLEHTTSFNGMTYWFGETNLYLYNRSMQMSLPGPDHINAQSPELKNDGKYTLFVRCRDGNGNANLGEMAIEFCVEPGPDATPAWIMRTSIDNGAPVSYGTISAALDIYLNEPAECSWSFTDQDYENMNNTFSCATLLENMETDLTYKCATTLTNIQDKVENTYYFRCKDQPWLSPANESDRNMNKQSYVFKLQGTQSLNITSVAPNGTIYWGSEPVPVNLNVETVNGYDFGEATCYYSETGYDNMIEFFETDASSHEQKLDLLEGDYTYYILCRDLAGNVDKATAQFTAAVDRNAPIIIRVYQDAGMLKVVTDEDSDCRYGIKGCNFDFTTATEMPFDGTTEHTAEWRTDITYYIKCRDEFGNMPAPSDCSMQVNAYDVQENE